MNTPHTTAIRQATEAAANRIRQSLYDGLYPQEAENLIAGIIGEHLPPLLEQAEKERSEALSSLQWIADQPCEQKAEGSSEDFSCTETGACATEWCLPCYARSALGEGPHACPRCDAYEKAQSLMDEAEWAALKALRAAGSDSLVAVAMPLADGIKALAKERDQALARAAAAEGELADLREVHAASVGQEKIACDAAYKFRDERDTALAELAACEAAMRDADEAMKTAAALMVTNGTCNGDGHWTYRALESAREGISAHLSQSKGSDHG